MVSYNRQTVDTPNPIARFSHRSRIRKSLSIVRRCGCGAILDYGCGAGHFVNAINVLAGYSCVGYEPFMIERQHEGLPIFNHLSEIEKRGPFDMVTLFETIEHLDDNEARLFLSRAASVLKPGGRILFSAPIEIGPAIFAKELNRSILHRRPPENTIYELLLAGFLGIPARRADNIKTSHKGFDYRAAIQFVERECGPVEIISYSPLPLVTWYGNSQVFFWATPRGTQGGSF